jgi:hypothetical protein
MFAHPLVWDRLPRCELVDAVASDAQERGRLACGQDVARLVIRRVIETDGDELHDRPVLVR